MAFDMEGLMDFGSGALRGGEVGAKMSGGNPYATAAGAIGLGALSYFGGAPERRMEKKYNQTQIALGEFELSEARRNAARDRDKDRGKKVFGQLLGEYFRRKT